MTNTQLDTRSDLWFPPKYVTDRVRAVIPQIDLDPASYVEANALIKADRIIDRGLDSLVTVWSDKPVSVFLNSPGGKKSNKSVSALFWQKLMNLRQDGLLKEAIFMSFSLEHMSVTQSCTQSMCHFPVVIPKKRIKFENPEGQFNSPVHASVLVYVPGLVDNTEKFVDIFKAFGDIVVPYN